MCCCLFVNVCFCGGCVLCIVFCVGLCALFTCVVVPCYVRVFVFAALLLCLCVSVCVVVFSVLLMCCIVVVCVRVVCLFGQLLFVLCLCFCVCLFVCVCVNYLPERFSCCPVLCVFFLFMCCSLFCLWLCVRCSLFYVSVSFVLCL